MDDSGRLPDGLELTALDGGYRDDPYPRLARLREQAPVRMDATFGMTHLTRYADVRAVLTDRTLWRDPLKAEESSAPYRRAARDREELGRDPVASILTSDDPDHARVRGVFTPLLYRRVSGSRALVDRIVRARLDALEGEAAFDLIARFALPIPIEVIAHMLGVDEARLDEFRAWSEAIIQTFNPGRTPGQTAAMHAALDAAYGYFGELMERRRAEPCDDLITDLVQAQAGGAPVTDGEIKVNCNTLLIAGNLTTTDLIGNGARLLMLHPEQRDRLLAEPGLIGAAVEEMLRFESPVDSTGRVASRAMEIGGCPVAARQALQPSIRAANRDPAAFDAPDRFDISAKRAPHVAFGGGAHICLGAPLARMEAQAALLALFQRFPRLRLAEGEPQWRSLPFFRGLERLPVEVAPTPEPRGLPSPPVAR